MRFFGIFTALATITSVFAAPTLEAGNGLGVRHNSSPSPAPSNGGTCDMPTACKIHKFHGFVQDCYNQIQPITVDASLTSDVKATKVEVILRALGTNVNVAVSSCDDIVDNSRDTVVGLVADIVLIIGNIHTCILNSLLSSVLVIFHGCFAPIISCFWSLQASVGWITYPFGLDVNVLLAL